jgi:hypothetical protein
MGEESGNVFVEWKDDDLRNRPGEIGWLREKRGGSRSGAGRAARYENRFLFFIVHVGPPIPVGSFRVST